MGMPVDDPVDRCSLTYRYVNLKNSATELLGKRENNEQMESKEQSGMSFLMDFMIGVFSSTTLLSKSLHYTNSTV